MRIVLKLGGSLIVNKDIVPTSVQDLKKNSQKYVRSLVIERCIKEISSAIKDKNIQLFIIHGVGHYGHFLIDKERWKELGDIKMVHSYCDFLKKKVVRNYKHFGLKIKIFPPFETCFYDFERKEFNINNLWDLAAKTLEKNQIPLTHGDIIPTKPPNKGKYDGYEVISGDDLAILVAKLWKANKVIMATDVDGLYDKNPKKYKDAKLLFKKISPEQKISIFTEKGIDVTGGITEKIRKLQLIAKDGIKSQIINALKEKNLEKALKGDESIGTLISK
jgi:isopentenyl phosphate kinase